MILVFVGVCAAIYSPLMLFTHISLLLYALEGNIWMLLNTLPLSILFHIDFSPNSKKSPSVHELRAQFFSEQT